MINYESLIKYITGAKKEALQIVWPEVSDVKQTVMMIFIIIAISSLCLVSIDYIIHTIIKFLLKIG
jgi:preprotein translocase SecE subunit